MAKRLEIRALRKPLRDEFYAFDFKDNKVAGSYDMDGYFIVDESERFGVKGRCDANGYLLDRYNYKVVNPAMRDRL